MYDSWGGGGKMYVGLGGELCGKELLGRPRRRWEDNIQVNFYEIWEGAS